jgi:hypothetical protein
MSPVLHVHVEGSWTLQFSVVVGRRRTGFPLLVVFMAFLPPVSYRCAIFFSMLRFSHLGIAVLLSDMPNLRHEGLFACSSPDCLRWTVPFFHNSHCNPDIGASILCGQAICSVLRIRDSVLFSPGSGTGIEKNPYLGSGIQDEHSGSFF